MNSGQFGEAYVAWRLEKKGARILARNWHSRYGEIDIIAQYQNLILFVEVKTRRQGSESNPLEAVTRGKQRRLICTAQAFLLQKQEWAAYQPRFDVAAVWLGESGKVCAFTYVPGAFDARL